jgi:exo-beta-1,3-glucanase (GH17 family)
MCARIGINYGKVANDLLAPAGVVTLIQSIPMDRAKLYDADPLVLKTFTNTGISFHVGVPNEELEGLAASAAAAEAWVRGNVSAYHPATDIVGIVVGNEIYGGSDAALVPYVVPAMKNIHAALAASGLGGKLIVSTTHSFAVLSASYPPSAGAFVASITESYIQPLLAFLADSGSPFMINAYPFFAYKDSPDDVSLEYALFESNPGVLDPATGARYYNLFDAMIDAVHSAIDRLGFGANVSVLVSETGWPSAGDPDELGASPANARLYHDNLFLHLASHPGTPLRPNASIDVFLFALFNENLKPGAASETHYGLFKPDGSKAYSFNFSSSSSSSSSSSAAPASAPRGLCWLAKAFSSSLLCIVFISARFF